MPEFGSHQFEIPVAAAEGIAAADRAVVLREVVREVARREGHARSFAPLLDPAGPGNGVHIHLSLLDGDGRPVLYDAERPASLSELGGRFAAGVLLHARALSALSAPSPASAARLRPHHWSAGAVCLARQNREALLRIPPLVSLGEDEPGRSCAWSTAAQTPPPTRTSPSARSCARDWTACARGFPRRRSSTATRRCWTTRSRPATASEDCQGRWRTRCGRSPRMTPRARG